MTAPPAQQLVDGWYQPADRVASPNFDARPADVRVEALIIHSISLPPGQYGGDEIEAFFCNQLPSDAHPYFQQIGALTVSSHFLIKRDGRVVQFVDTDQRAWHAGESVCLGRERVNDFSIGIELEGWDESDDGFTDAQYTQLIRLSDCLLSYYSVPVTQIFGHSDIAPTRKNDPGPHFDWQRYRKGLSND